MATDADIKYTSISQLPPLEEALKDDDLLVVSHLTAEINELDEDNFDSMKIEYGQIKSDLCAYLHDFMYSNADKQISAAVDNLSSSLDEISANLNCCLSAIVAFDHCRTKLVDRVSTLELSVEILNEHIINS